MASKTSNKLIIEGFALQDNIIALRHCYPNGVDGPSLRLRTLIYDGDLQQQGFSHSVSLRDTTSGKQDKKLLQQDGTERFLFLSVNVHKFEDSASAKAAVLAQCQKFREVRNNE